MQALPNSYEIVYQSDTRYSLEVGEISGNWFYRISLTENPEQLHGIGTSQSFGCTKEQAIDAGVRVAQEMLNPDLPRKMLYQ